MRFSRNKGAKLAQQLTREHRPRPPQLWGDARAAASARCIPQLFHPLRRARTTAALRCSRVRGFTRLANLMWGWLGIFHWDGFQHILAHSKISGFPWGNFCFMGLEGEIRTKCRTSALLRQLLELGSVVPPPRDAPGASRGASVLAGLGRTTLPAPDPGREQQGFRAERVRPEFAVPKGLGWAVVGDTVCSQPGWQDGRSGCQAAAPTLFLCRFLGCHPS